MREKALQRRIQAAAEKDPSIIISKKELDEHLGFTQSYLTSLGLRKSDLKSMEAHGFAHRGYEKETYKTALGNKKELHRVKWVLLLAEEGEDGASHGRLHSVRAE